jgi:hypothetical protein
MTEDIIRRWMRGDLRGAERRDVTRWVVRCTDPDLAVLLHGLSLEITDEARDAALNARGPFWARLSDAWRSLLDAGRAQATLGLDAGLVLARATDDAKAATLTLLRDSTGVVATFRPDPARASSRTVVMVVTDDGGTVQRLAVQGDGIAWVARLPEPLGDRTTVWAALSPPSLRQDDPTAEFEAMIAAAGADVWASRILPE